MARHMITEEPLSGLDELPDPDRIRSKKLVGDIATIVADASGLSDAERSALETRLRQAVAAQPGVREARVALTASKPGRTFIAIGSGKGGVGKSTLATNLAIALARMGKKVGIVDADIYGPSQPTLLGTTEKPQAEHNKLVPVEVQWRRLLSVGQLVSAGQALAWRGPMASGALTQLIDGAWGDTEIILVDLPPGTGDVQLFFVQKSRPAGAVIVSTPP